MKPLSLLHRFFRHAAWLAVGLGIVAPARADEPFPNRSLTLIVPFPAGSVTDTQMRAIVQSVGKTLGQSVVVVNRPGATGTLGPSTMAKMSRPDGYTVSVVPSSLVGLPHLQKVSYDPLKDFTYIIGLTGYSFALVVKADSPMKTIDDYLAKARADPGGLTFASSGIGGGTHLAMAQMELCENVHLSHITFKGGADATTALLGGHVASEADGAWGGLADAGQARPLLILTPTRVPQYPNVPTLKERCPKASVDAQAIGIAGPAGMDPTVVRTLHDAFKGAMSDEGFVNALKAAKQVPIYMSSRDYADYMATTFAQKKALIKAIGLIPE